LSFGFTCAILALLYINNIVGFNKFHGNYSRLYSVEAMVTYFNGDRFPKEFLSASLPELLKKQAPEIEEVTRITDRNCSFVHEEKTFSGRAIYADRSLFHVFTFPLEQGNRSSVLNDPNSVVISEPTALKFFGNTDCIGKTLTMTDGNKQEAYRITGVFRKIPAQSTLQFDYVIPFEKYLSENTWAEETGAASNMTWALLKDQTDCAHVDQKIKDLIKSQEDNLNQELFLFPLKDKALFRYTKDGKVWQGMQMVVIVGAVGLVILLIACFNFINLAVAMNIKRYRETGIKKVVGSRKSVIMLQFLGESSIIILASLLTASFLVDMLLPFLNATINADIHLRLPDLKTILILIGIALFTGIVAGILPALYLASSNPLTVLKGRIAPGHNYSIFRQSLIVFQFTIPVALIICMMVIKSQDFYMRHYDLGVDQDRLIILDNSENIQRHAEGVKTDLLALSGIEGVTFTSCIPSRGAGVVNDVNWEGKDPAEKLHVWCVNTDFDYNKVVEIKMTDGRFFDPSYPSDSACYVINDVAAQVMKKDNPVGSLLTLEGKKGTIIGTFKDFHALDLSGPYTPVIIRIKPDDRQFLLVKYSSGVYSSIVNSTKKVCKSYDPDAPFQATLFRNLIPYRNLSLPSRLVGIAFIIALILACMGLFGLASFTSESRTKEIGVRKTNGATTVSMMRLLLTNYIRWLGISFLIAVPIAFMLSYVFLSRFYFHTPLPVWTFIAGPLIAFTIALLTVISLTWRVANRNPVEALRYE
jgi:ABC-type antimicrobial peptide transport system permease subunit